MIDTGESSPRCYYRHAHLKSNHVEYLAHDPGFKEILQHIEALPPASRQVESYYAIRPHINQLSLARSKFAEIVE